MFSILFLSLLLWPSFTSAQAPEPAKVETGAYLISLHDLNFKNKEFTVSFWLWLVFDSTDITEHDVEITNAQNIEIQNVNRTYSADGRKVLQIRYKCVIKQDWILDNYPFDRQRLEIKVESSKYAKANLQFVFKNEKPADDKLKVDGWHITHYKMDTTSRYYATTFGENPAGKKGYDFSVFRLEIDLKRESWSLFLKLFAGMYVSFAMAYLSLYIKMKYAEARFALPVGGLFSIIGNKYVIDSILPETNILTLVDYLHLTTLIFMVLIIGISVVSLYFYQEKEEETSDSIDIGGEIGILILYITLNVVFIGRSFF